ncbi:Asp-tRNA(Asn)/Glu-tRNA(Gln) amidotransferase subunit GatA [Candidatus Woesearchaeota archaeon]|nr:Asp-tRNA(Asn)/Glu-tRNA(Gln) amidotransferase subunit GatA [Candidatus Woesearchaeota archaeon]
MIQEYIKRVQSGEDCSEVIAKFFDEAKRIENYNYFTVLTPELAKEQALLVSKRIKAGEFLPLAGLPVTIKDCICVKGVETTAGSDILRGYKPLFNASVVQRLINAGAVIVGKTSQDEFGFGGFGINTGVGFSPAKNPLDPSRVCGGSSSGCGGITRKTSLAHVGIGESTGGSIVNPAAFCGVFGLCPTYGRVSRYGLIDYANSLDKIGSLAKDLGDCASVMSVISGFDEMDETTSTCPVPDYGSFLAKGVKGLRVARIKEAFGEGVDEHIKNKVHSVITNLEKQGASIREVSIPVVAEYAVPVYYLIAMSEASTNLAKFCGMRYGQHAPLKGSFDEYFSAVRTRHFGAEAKRRILLGTFARMAGYRDAYYLKALKIRTLIIEEYKKVFCSSDVLVSPTMPVIPPVFEDVKRLTPLQNYMMDILTVGPNLAGLPHLSVPVNKEWVGVMFTADHYKEELLFQAGGGCG